MKRTTQQFEFSEGSEELARLAKALGHPVRIEIVRLLGKQACCFTGDLVELFPFAQSTISQHLKELKDAGILQGEINPPKVKYCLNQQKTQRIKELINNLL